MFNSNVAPRVRKKMIDAKQWLCKSCGRENGHWLKRCPGCGAHK